MHAEHDPQLSPEERRLAAQLRATLESEPVDAVTAARLSAARRRALSAAQRPARRAPLWAGAALAAGVVAALGLNLLPLSLPTAPKGAGLDEESLDWIALAEESPEFYRELEFYEWLDDAARPG